MELRSLNLFSPTDQVAWVGSGGKSSLLFGTLHELFTTAFATTTTHILISQSELVDQSLSFSPGEILYLPEADSTKGIIFIDGGIDPDEPEKLKGLTPAQLKALSSHCFQQSLPLFIEADGARGKPLKAPADHEPVIPAFCKKVCVVAGLSAIGKTLTADYVHRPERFQLLLGIPDNSILTMNHLYDYLIHPEGGLKSIPAGAEKFLFLNQSDTFENIDQVLELALKCKLHYDHVLITSSQGSRGGLEVLAHFGKIAVSILAAGEAKRFQQPKQLQVWKEKSFIRHIIETVNQTSLNPKLVILGAYGQRITQEIEDLNIINVRNDEWESGQASSVRKAVSRLSGEIEAVIFLLVDQPQTTVEMVNQIIKLYAKTKAPIITHQYKNQYRHPVLFSREVFPFLLELQGDSGGRQLFSLFPPATIIIEDPYFALDIDTPADLQAFLKQKHVN